MKERSMSPNEEHRGNFSREEEIANMTVVCSTIFRNDVAHNLISF